MSKRWRKYYTPVEIDCNICGKPMDRTIYGRRRYHDECVIQDYINACNEGAGSMDLRKHRFWNFGFTKDEAEEFKARFQTEEE